MRGRSVEDYTWFASRWCLKHSFLNALHKSDERPSCSRYLIQKGIAGTRTAIHTVASTAILTVPRAGTLTGAGTRIPASQSHLTYAKSHASIRIQRLLQKGKRGHEMIA